MRGRGVETHILRERKWERERFWLIQPARFLPCGARRQYGAICVLSATSLCVAVVHSHLRVVGGIGLAVAREWAQTVAYSARRA